MQRRDDRNAACARHGRQVERQIEQAVDVDDVRLHRSQHVRDPIADKRWPIGLLERRADPVVDDFDDREPLMRAPGDVAMPARRVVLRGEDAHVVAGRQRTAQLERVDLGPRLVPRQEIVDRVEDTQALIIAPCPAADLLPHIIRGMSLPARLRPSRHRRFGELPKLGGEFLPSGGGKGSRSVYQSTGARGFSTSARWKSPASFGGRQPRIAARGCVTARSSRRS